MSSFFEFNTGRLYSEDGQIIRWYKEPSEGLEDRGYWDVWFYDISRGIIGKVPTLRKEFVNNEWVLRLYDRNLHLNACFSDPQIRKIVEHFREEDLNG